MTFTTKDYKGILDLIDIIYAVPDRAVMFHQFCERWFGYGEVSGGRIAGIVVSKDQCASRRGIVVRVLEPGDGRSELQKLLEVEVGSIREGAGAFHNRAEWGRSSYPRECETACGVPRIYRRISAA